MIADMHVHSTFSPDGISTMEEQCIAALEKGERIICFTDHVDYNVAEKNNGIIKDNSKANFIIEEYLIEIDRLRKKYPELKILKGIEFSVDFAATSPTARGKKSTFTGKEAHFHGHEVHREQRGFCPSAP